MKKGQNVGNIWGNNKIKSWNHSEPHVFWLKNVSNKETSKNYQTGKTTAAMSITTIEYKILE